MTPETEARLVAVLERIESALTAPQLGAARKLATVREVQALLGVGRRRVFDLLREKTLVGVRDGRKRMVDLASVERYRQRVTPAPAGTRRGRPPKSKRSEGERIAEIKID